MKSACASLAGEVVEMKAFYNSECSCSVLFYVKLALGAKVSPHSAANSGLIAHPVFHKGCLESFHLKPNSYELVYYSKCQAANRTSRATGN